MSHHDVEDYAGLPLSSGAAPRQVALPTCRFYGCSYVVLKRLNMLESQLGNECACVTDAYTPCKWELLFRHPPDEKRCPIAKGYLRRHPETPEE